MKAKYFYFQRRVCLFVGVMWCANIQAAAPKNVILMIGDGMGPQQIGLLLTYARLAPDSIYQDQGRVCAIEDFINQGVTGLSLTSPADKVVVDSACSATQLATGAISGSEMIGLDAEGYEVETVLELAKRRGKAAGLVSDTRLTHATPAAFASHVAHRSSENEIALQMLNTGVDVMFSGGLRHWIPFSVNDNASDVYQHVVRQTGGFVKLSSKREDELNLLDLAHEKGYELVCDRDHLKKTESQRVLGLFANSGMANGIKHTHWKLSEDRKEPTLQEMTEQALEILSEHENGFFLMIEGGQIDWAGHANDTADMLHEMIKFDDAVRSVLDWVNSREDTVVVLTADHETGGFGFSYSRRDIPAPSLLPGDAFSDQFFHPRFNFMKREILDQIYQQKQNHFHVMEDFYSLETDKQTAEKLAELLRVSTGFPVTSSEAATVLDSEPNQHHCEGHPYLEEETFPKVDDFEEFYVYGEEIRSDLIGRVLAKYQNAVWATGTHTATPVTVTAVGCEDAVAAVKGLHTHPEIGDFLKRLIDAS